ncbi:hypothetical protein [Acinetobacter johnsonii]|uniref:hypothetical protein n=1 Tax=Acinetobacter johnsonii TaxID=40214 RepID=UPI0024475B68|nr:hypothetical protein [Acinetobacter johnsonii]
MKILTVIGARPQFIKASVVSAAINKAASLSEEIIHTNQYFDANISNVFLKNRVLQCEIKPNGWN